MADQQVYEQQAPDRLAAMRDILAKTQAIAQQPYNPAIYPARAPMPQNTQIANAMAGQLGEGSPYQYMQSLRESADTATRAGNRHFPQVQAEYMAPYQRAVVDRLGQTDNLLPLLMKEFGNEGRHAGLERSAQGNIQRELGTHRTAALFRGHDITHDIFNKDLLRQLYSAETLGKLGIAQQQAHTQDIGSLAQAGERERSELDAAREYQQFKNERQQMWPREMLSFRSGILHGLPVDRVIANAPRPAAAAAAPAALPPQVFRQAPPMQPMGPQGQRHMRQWAGLPEPPPPPPPAPVIMPPMAVPARPAAPAAPVVAPVAPVARPGAPAGLRVANPRGLPHAPGYIEGLPAGHPYRANPPDPRVLALQVQPAGVAINQPLEQLIPAVRAQIAIYEGQLGNPAQNRAAVQNLIDLNRRALPELERLQREDAAAAAGGLPGIAAALRGVGIVPPAAPAAVARPAAPAAPAPALAEALRLHTAALPNAQEIWMAGEGDRNAGYAMARRQEVAGIVAAKIEALRAAGLPVAEAGPQLYARLLREATQENDARIAAMLARARDYA